MGAVVVIKFKRKISWGACGLADYNENTERGEADHHPAHVPPERTGVTPEEEAYTPPAEVRPIPRGVIGAAAAILAILLISCGTIYYRGNILPEQLYQKAARNMQSGAYQEAREQLEEVYRLKPERRDTPYQLAYAQEMLGDTASAVEFYRKHLENQPGDLDALHRLSALLFAAEDYEAALPLYEEILSRQPLTAEDPDLHYALGYIYEARGDNERAAGHYVAFVESPVNDPEILLTVSRVLMKLGHYKEALAGFTKAGEYLPADDTRALHAVRAAKNMLGWPTDDEMVIDPGRSIGNMKLGIVANEAQEAWGDPIHIVNEGEHAVWGYGGNEDAPQSFVYFEDDEVIEIVTTTANHRTADGLSLANFREPKYTERFRRLRDETQDPTVYRYTLKEGGLAFYFTGEAGENARAVIYGGESPLTENYGMTWRYYWD